MRLTPVYLPEVGTQAQFWRDVQQVVVGQIQSQQVDQFPQVSRIHPAHLIVSQQHRLQGDNVIQDLRKRLEPVVGSKRQTGDQPAVFTGAWRVWLGCCSGVIPLVVARASTFPAVCL